MKRTLTTILIAALTGISGYYIGKNDLPANFSLPTMESSNKSDRQYSAEVVVQINPYGKKTRSLGINAQEAMITRQFFQTQFAIISNDQNITKAIKDYKLAELFAEDETALRKTIQANLELSQVRGTDLLRIKALSDTEEKAQQICYAVVNSYDQRRRDNIENTRNEVIEKYKQKIEAQEDKVEDKRGKLYKLSKQLGIPYHGIKGQEATTYSNHKKPINAVSIYDSSKRERDELEILVKGLKNQDYNKLLASNRPEAAILKSDNAKLKELILARENLRASGIGANHPRIKAITVAINATKDQLAESWRLTSDKLTNDLVTMDKRLELLKKDSIAAVQKQQLSAEDHTQFGKVKDEYEREFHILQSIKAAEFRETIVSGLELDPLQYHKYAASDEVRKMMQARKQEKK